MLTLKSREVLAGEFGVCPKTFRKYLRTAEIELPRGMVRPSYQKLIYEQLWYPDGVEEELYEKVKLPEEKGV